MLRILFKKQITELFKNYFYSAKKNKTYSKGSTVFLFVLFALLLLGLAGTFAFVAVSISVPMAKSNTEWLYFAVMGLMAIALGAFGSVFNTYSSLYLPKDNDLLLSMPIPVNAIIASRLLVVYVMGLLYSGLISIPAVIVFWVSVSFGVKTVIGGLFFVLLVSLFVMTLSCFLGWILAKISVKTKRKNVVISIVSLLFVCGTHAVSFYAQTFFKNLIVNSAEYGAAIKEKAYFVYIIGNLGVGNGISILVDSAVVLVLLFLVLWLISRSFLKLATTTSSEKKSKREKNRKEIKQKSVFGALLGKEFTRFATSPNYTLNCGLGVILLPVAGIVLLIKGENLANVLNALFVDTPNTAQIVACVIVASLSCMIMTVTPSVSLEGKTIWISQSLPIDAWKILETKLSVQLILGGAATVVCLILVAFSKIFNAVSFLITILYLAAFLVLYALFGAFIGLKMPIMNWTNEITPIKQNVGVMISTFVGFVFAAIPLLYLVSSVGKIGYDAFLGILTVISVVLCVPLFVWLKKKGSVIYQTL